MYETLILAFEGLEDWQPIGHAEFIEFHSELDESYIEDLFSKQVQYCTRYVNQVIREPGISKIDIFELNQLGLIWVIIDNYGYT